MGEEQVVIMTKLGQLRGKILLSDVFNKPFYCFQGIPYAKPPIGELRFKAPQPFGGWEGIRDALESGNSSLQQVLFPLPGTDPNKPEGSEDCLYLNVYFNELPEKSSRKKPVMFSIHGGGFSGGSGSLNFGGPDYLLSEDVVVVTTNYRCGALGFLSLGTEDVPGNAGMKDQVLALKWVRDNIDSFGGDSNNVTIFGISAGGASVDLHLLSPLSQGLFHKAIVQSGFSTNPWVIQPSPEVKALELAKTLGCKSENVNEVLTFLQSLPASQILDGSKKVTQRKNFVENDGTVFIPSVEVAGENPFLSEKPAKLLKKGQINKVPVVLGCCANEGVAVVFFGGFKENVFDLISKKHELLVPHFLGLEPGSVEEKTAANSIWEFYMKGKPVSWDTVNDYVTYNSDFLFTIGMEKTRCALLEFSSFPLYSYFFTVHSKNLCFCPIYPLLDGGNENMKNLDTKESCHGADCKYLYSTRNIPSGEKSTADKEAILRHVKAWTSFASTGDPNHKDSQVSWEMDSKISRCYMEIGKNWAMKNGAPFHDRIEFWKQLCSKYNKEL